MTRLRDLIGALQGDGQADRVVPPTGFTARLTVFSAAVMTFLAVFALALSVATGRLATQWGEELAQSSTLRISAPADQIETQTETALRVLETTEGVRSARALTEEQQQALLEPWFGPDVPLDTLPVPQLIEIIEEDGFDPAGLRLRLQAEVPGAVLDDHTRWRRPLVKAASWIRTLGFLSLLLIGAATAAMITLAANAALAANLSVISVLRLVGAQDSYITRAFVRRFTLRALAGAAGGMVLGMLAILALPDVGTEGGFLTGLGFQGAQWLWPLLLPPVAGAVAFAATRRAALRLLEGLT